MKEEELLKLSLLERMRLPALLKWRIVKGKVYGTTTRDIEIFSENRIIKKGTKVIVWMASRMGDIGITDNLVDALGYCARVEDEAVTNLIEIRKV